MSKNLIVLFIIILLIVGGFGIYTYDQSNQAKREVEEKNLKLESSEELISELKENIQEKEKQIEELKASLAEGKKDLEKEYADKLTELTEEKAKLEALLAEKEETIKTIVQQKEESEQIVISKDELILELKENIQEKEKQIDELKADLTKEEKDSEKEFAVKISELIKEKGQLEALLVEQQGILQTKDREKEELVSKLEDCNNQINELKDKLVQQEIEEEKDYVAKLSALTEEKSKLENQLKIYQDLLTEKEDTIVLIKQQNEESEKSIAEKDKTIVELSESIKGYENQIKEISEQAAKEKEKQIEKETEYSNKLSLLTEEKSKLETQLKASKDLLLERENTIALFKQQKEDLEKVISDKDKTIAELFENIKGYENLVKELQEKMAQEEKEKEAEYAAKLALLKEGKKIIEAKLAEAIKKTIPDYYEVKKGDSLWKIAERFYNTGEKWIRIFEANTNKIKNPNIIYPYQRLTIPKE